MGTLRLPLADFGASATRSPSSHDRVPWISPAARSTSRSVVGLVHGTAVPGGGSPLRFENGPGLAVQEREHRKRSGRPIYAPS